MHGYVLYGISKVPFLFIDPNFILCSNANYLGAIVVPRAILISWPSFIAAVDLGPISLQNQIWWECHKTVIQFLIIRLQQDFAHVMTAMLSCHVQNFVAKSSIELGWEQIKNDIKLELWWKIL